MGIKIIMDEGLRIKKKFDTECLLDAWLNEYSLIAKSN